MENISCASSMTAFYASHKINDVEYQNNLLQELKLSFKYSLKTALR